MGYFLRAFCTEPTVPALVDVIEWTRQHGWPVQIDPEALAEDAEGADWFTRQVPILYKEGNLPFLVEVNRKGTSEGTFEEEIQEFLEAVGDTRWSLAKGKIIKHLRNTQFTVACQLPTSDMEDDDYDADGWFMAYFPKHCGGMVQCDGEGFYKGPKLILPLE